MKNDELNADRKWIGFEIKEGYGHGGSGPDYVVEVKYDGLGCNTRKKAIDDAVKRLSELVVWLKEIK